MHVFSHVQSIWVVESLKMLCCCLAVETRNVLVFFPELSVFCEQMHSVMEKMWRSATLERDVNPLGKAKSVDKHNDIF